LTKDNQRRPARPASAQRSKDNVAATAEPPKPGLEARMTAAKLIGAVIDRKTPLDGMLDASGGNPAYLKLADADRGLVRAILNTTLRHLPRIEAILASLVSNPLPEGARALHHVLVVAAAQILYLDIPDHSAVDLAVEQANRDPRNRRFAGLVNAVLRRLSREKDALLASVEHVSPMPDWFMKRLIAAYGAQEAAQIAAAQLVPAAIDLTVKSDPQGWAEKLGGHVLPTGSVRLNAFTGSIPELDGFDAGEWWVQDAAAAIPARLFGDISGQRIADLCSAPGGKTAQLAQAGAKVTAVEQSKSRLKRLEGNLARLNLSAESVEANLLDHQPEVLYDGVLLDAPCSSTGTTRRHPDVLWTKGPEDIARLAALQEKLLRHALTLVKPGGKVVFCNCSLDPSEGEELIARVLADTPDISLLPVSAHDFPGLQTAINARGEVRTTPAMLMGDGEYPGGTDGFFAAVLQKSIETNH